MLAESATVEQAALLSGQQKVLRVNMSSRVTIDELLGRVTLTVDADTKDPTFSFVEGPVLLAVKTGRWLLLDELNLVPDAVLAALETMLDTRQLVIKNSANAEESTITVAVSPNFRLFATQNPASGHFKGSRPPLSTAFLSRFAALQFQELPSDEWVEIVSAKLRAPSAGQDSASQQGPLPDDHCLSVARLLVDIHMAIQSQVRCKDWEEDAGYAAVSIRELLKWCEQMRCYSGQWSRVVGPVGQERWDQLRHVLYYEVWYIYAARFRKAEARQRLLKVMAEHELRPLPTQPELVWSVADGHFSIDRFKARMKLPTVDALLQKLKAEFPDMHVAHTQFAAQTHFDCMSVLRCDDTIRQYGCYTTSSTWLRLWMQQAAAQAPPTLAAFAQLGAAIYGVG